MKKAEYHSQLFKTKSAYVDYAEGRNTPLHVMFDPLYQIWCKMSVDVKRQTFLCMFIA